MIDTTRAPSPLCAFMEQLGKSMGKCTIELVNDNARSHSPVPRRVKTRADDMLQNRWKATDHSNDRAMDTAYCRSPSRRSTTSDDCCRIEVSRGRAHQRWSTCENAPSPLTTLAQCAKRRPGGISNKSPPRRKSADHYAGAATSTSVTPSTDGYTPNLRPRRSWSSPTVSAKAPTFARRLFTQERKGIQL